MQIARESRESRDLSKIVCVCVVKQYRDPMEKKKKLAIEGRGPSALWLLGFVLIRETPLQLCCIAPAQPSQLTVGQNAFLGPNFDAKMGLKSTVDVCLVDSDTIRTDDGIHSTRDSWSMD
jgi:hypothetical protein